VTHTEIMLVIFFLIIGLIFGSFLNVVIYRLPIMILTPSKIDENLNLLYPSSHCSICKKSIRFYENIPILSYLILRGKCSNCNNQISLQYPIVEIVTAVVTLHASKHFNLGFDFIAILLFCYLLISITVIDFNHKIVPDILSFSLIISGITISCIFYLEGNKDILTEPISSIIGILFGYFLPFVIYKFHYSFTGKEGMGHGDFKLLAGLGAWLGWKMVPIVLFFAAITGLIYAFYLFVSKKIENDSLIPFAPFLSVAGWILMFYGERIMDGYVKILI